MFVRLKLVHTQAPCPVQNLLQTHKLVSQFWHNRQRKCHHFPVSHAKRLCFVISPEGTFGTNHLHHRDHTTQGFPEHHTTSPGINHSSRETLRRAF